MRLVCVEMVEDAGDDTWLGDFANDLEFAATTGTAADIDIEHAFEPSHPSHRCAGRFVGVVTVLGARVKGIGSHHQMTVSGVGCEQAVISDEMGSGSRYEGG